jgi:SAM-dependent methyltransferase
MIDSTLRFSDRADDYKKYRPSYPPEVVTFILENCQVDRTWRVADIGSGTGISSRLLARGLKVPVFAVEPNDRMRGAAEAQGRNVPCFHSVKGSAEATTLDTASMDLVCAFQSFHWFDRKKARSEFLRILREPRRICFVWNDRVTDEPGFLEEYERLMLAIPEYRLVNHKLITAGDLCSFAGDNVMRRMSVSWKQRVDWKNLMGRFSSSSYAPAPGTQDYGETLRKLRGLFDKYNRGGFVEYKYTTEAFLGMMEEE